MKRIGRLESAQNEVLDDIYKLVMVSITSFQAQRSKQILCVILKCFPR